jgi:hypothetical protein
MIRSPNRSAAGLALAGSHPIIVQSTITENIMGRHSFARDRAAAGGRQFIGDVGLEPPIAGAEPHIGAKHRIESVPVRTHSVTANDVVDRKASRKEYDNAAEQECDEVETFQILNKLKQRPVRHCRRSLSRLDRSRSVFLTLDFLLRRKFHCD